MSQAETTTGVLLTALVGRMLDKVELFNGRVRGQVIPATPQPLTDQQAQRAVDAFAEESKELLEATAAGDVLEQADAILDLVFFALGRLAEMGIPAWGVMEEINRANMEKKRGDLTKRTGWEGYDAVKPEGWTPPDHSWLLNFSLADVAKAKMFDELSPVFQEITKLRVAKGADYNNVEGGRNAYFPFGHFSHIHMLTTKVLRLQSLARSMADGKKPNFEGLRDSVKDLVNYGAFYAEALDSGKLEVTA
jgi:phosphoribosyl-ATP pyrophosphohydrolase